MNTKGHVDESRTVRRLRESMNMNQTDFSHRVGVTTRTVQLWEAGKHTPKGRAKLKLEQLKLTGATVTPAMKRWGVRTGSKTENHDVDMFLSDILDVCKKHGFVVVPEDDSVSSEVRRYDATTAALLMRSQTRL